MSNQPSLDATGHSQGGAPAQYAIYDLALAQLQLTDPAYRDLTPQNGGSKILPFLTEDAKQSLPSINLGVATLNGLGAEMGIKDMYGAYDPNVGRDVSTLYAVTSSGDKLDAVAQLSPYAFNDGNILFQLSLQPGMNFTVQEWDNGTLAPKTEIVPPGGYEGISGIACSGYNYFTVDIIISSRTTPDKTGRVRTGLHWAEATRRASAPKSATAWGALPPRP